MDVLETSEHIRVYKESQKIRRIIEGENITSSGSLELAGLNISNSDVLNAIILKSNVRILNLLENNIKNIDLIC